MEEFEYFYHCPTCGYDCVTHFYEQPYAYASFTCCCDNDILIESVDRDKHELICSSLSYDYYIENR